MHNLFLLNIYNCVKAVRSTLWSQEATIKNKTLESR